MVRGLNSTTIIPAGLSALFVDSNTSRNHYPSKTAHTRSKMVAVTNNIFHRRRGAVSVSGRHNGSGTASCQCLVSIYLPSRREEVFQCSQVVRQCSVVNITLEKHLNYTI